nr:venom protease-like [Leptinotarsa decemlineata]
MYFLRKLPHFRYIVPFMNLIIYVSGDTSDNITYIEEHPAWSWIPNDVCGLAKGQMKTRIIGGEEAKNGEFPWMVRLGETFDEDGVKFRLYTCGGALITKFYVLSAAHCGTELDIVKVGDNSIEMENCEGDGCAPQPQNILIEEFFLNDYRYDNHQNDIMLIQLETPVEFNDYVKPVCLPRGNLLENNLMGKYFTVAGWGRTTNGNDGKDSCTGDSGGPLTRAFKIDGKKRSYTFGIVSYGLKDCGEGPGIYTRVISFLPWILDNIKKY